MDSKQAINARLEPPANTKEKPWEDTVFKLEEFSHQNLALLALWSRTASFQN